MARTNWQAIKRRYLDGERPVDIAKAHGLTSKQIRDKASGEKWGCELEPVAGESPSLTQFGTPHSKAKHIINAVLDELIGKDGSLNRVTLRTMPMRITTHCLTLAYNKDENDLSETVETITEVADMDPKRI